MKKSTIRKLMVSLFFFGLALGSGVFVLFKYVASDTICDSTEKGKSCSQTEILEDNQLTRLNATNNLDVRRVFPPQTTGFFGINHIKYAVPLAEVEAEIQKWQREPEVFRQSSGNYPNYCVPKWWPLICDVTEVGSVHKSHRNTSMSIWTNKRSGIFNIYTEWGH